MASQLDIFRIRHVFSNKLPQRITVPRTMYHTQIYQVYHNTWLIRKYKSMRSCIER